MSVTGNTSLEFSEEQAMLMDVAQEFCRDKSPIAAVREQLETATGFDQAVWDEMVALGWTGIALPEACGGSAMGVATVVPVVEAMGRAMLGTPLVSTTLASHLLMRASEAEQVQGLLAEVVDGAIATVALLDNGDWGDTRIQCSLDAEGVLQGQKLFVTDASVASFFVVVAEQQGTPALAVVRADALPADAIKERVLIDQTKRSANIDFTGVKAEQVISGEKVVSALRDLRLLGALLTAAETTGSTSACIDTITEYLTTRKQFGQLIGSYQALKHPTVEILNQYNYARSFIYHAATLIDDGSLSEDAEVACRMAKAQASDALAYGGDRAVQFHGGMGFTYECDAQLYIRRAQWVQQQFGDAMHHRKRLATLLLDPLVA
ncbi:acyl-CoA dehydrogenase family protein [Maricurvus nonylphenolicus]|uniref:acyl-CoA dehydrogenase family protein n=1 Tax=Maricurvus nonylphenolicus TaxID=1008307 RepID=UPI0036F1B87E